MTKGFMTVLNFQPNIPLYVSHTLIHVPRLLRLRNFLFKSWIYLTTFDYCYAESVKLLLLMDRQ